MDDNNTIARYIWNEINEMNYYDDNVSYVTAVYLFTYLRNCYSPVMSN